MKIFNMLSGMFNKLPNPGQSVKGFIKEQRPNFGKDANFFNLMIRYLGSRSYNEFLDYSLLAIKLNAIYNKHCFLVEGTWDEMQGAISKLLTDDRHDLWQNLPYYLDDASRAIEKKNGAEKVSAFWADVVDALIDCINVNGTGDISVNFTIEEE